MERKKKMSLLFLQMSVQKLFFSQQFLKEQELLNPNNVWIAFHFHAKQIFIFVSLEKSVGNNLYTLFSAGENPESTLSYV